ncbi:MAG: hypothetical protein PHQ98_01640 [Candidatus ainarchaeum sp.]|nr:hypothetical protein [Candidatus ainarchaeum sp.]
MEPVKKIKIGLIEVAVWENTAQDGNKFFSTTLDKNYKDGENWKKTNSLNEKDLPKAILALQKAYEFIALKE